MNPIPSVILFCNDDLSEQVEGVMVSQLMLTEVMDGYEFDARVAADPNYPTEVHLNHLRIMVLRSFFDLTNRDLADIVIFVKAGLASVECNKIGPPTLTLPVAHLRWEKLFFYRRVEDGHCPEDCDCHCRHKFPQYCGHTQSNILYPRFDHHETYKYPFGTDPICEKKRD